MPEVSDSGTSRFLTGHICLIYLYKNGNSLLFGGDLLLLFAAHRCGLLAAKNGEPPSSSPVIVVEGNAPAWPVDSSKSGFGDKGSNFIDLWQRKAFYADHTGYLRLLDDRGCDVYLRPQRFGKSLWLSTMECYYDVRRSFVSAPSRPRRETAATLEMREQ